MLYVNVNVNVYSLISHRVQQTSQFTPLALELSLIQSRLLWREFTAYSASNAIHNLHFSFHQVPITAGWTEAAWYERLDQHLYIWLAARLKHRSPIHGTNWAQHCLTSVVWRELVTTRPCATLTKYAPIWGGASRSSLRHSWHGVLILSSMIISRTWSIKMPPTRIVEVRVCAT